MFYNTSEVAKLLGTTRQTVINWCNAGKINFKLHPVNGYRLFDKDYINGLVEAMKNG